MDQRVKNLPLSLIFAAKRALMADIQKEAVHYEVHTQANLNQDEPVLSTYTGLLLARFAAATERALEADAFTNATSLWAATEDIIETYSENVNFYNLLLHSPPNLASGTCAQSERLAWSEAVLESVERNLEKVLDARVAGQTLGLGRGRSRNVGATHQTSRRLHGANLGVEEGAVSGGALFAEAVEKLRTKYVDRLHTDPLDGLMNGPIRQKLGIIPKNVRSGSSCKVSREMPSRCSFACFQTTEISDVEQARFAGTYKT